MATHTIAPPAPFNFKNPEEWPKWIRRFERYRISTELNEKDEVLQINTMIYCMGDEADDIVMSFTFAEGDEKKYTKVKEKFDQHFIIKRNVIFERARFNMRKQEPSEPVDAFITDLYCLSEHCEFGALREELIRDRIVVGLQDVKLSEKLQMDSSLTLQTAINKARQNESVKKQQEILRSGSTDPPASPEVDEVNEAKGKRDGRPHYPKKKKCMRCGSTSENHSRQKCPARDATCVRCNKRGHFAKVCLSAPKKVNEIAAENAEEQNETDSEDDGFFLGAIGNKEEKMKRWSEQIEVNGVTIKFKLDTGADVTVIGDSIYSRIFSNTNLLRTHKKLFGPCKSKLHCLGILQAKLRLNGKSCDEDVYVVENLETPLLGRSACLALDTVAKVGTVTQSADNIKARFPNVFSGLGCMDGEYEIKMTPSHEPFNQTTPRRVPIPLLPKVKDELDRMETMGVIEKVDAPTEWCSPIVVVPKPNGKVRICGDFIQLNKAVLRENHPMPTTEQTLGKLAGAKVISKLDANSGFWQRKLKDSSKLLTTFITPWGRYCYARLPFGISSAPEHFQKSMQRILEDLPGVECQMDDIIVYGANQAEHDERLEAVLTRLQWAKVTLNWEKCEFSKDTVKFLGQLVGKDGIRPDPSKVSAVKHMTEPTDIHELRRFLGMVNQSGKYIPRLAELTHPLRELLSKKNAWVWSPHQQHAFNVIKEKLSSAPALAIFDPALETTLSADASSYGLGAVMTQKQKDGNWKPVVFISRALSATERRYAQIEKEALATTWACERLADYLIGKRFHVETDHKPLVPILGSKNLEEMSPRIQRLRMRLLRFDFTVSHVPGKSLITADALSRAPVEQQDGQSSTEEEIDLYVQHVFASLPASNTQLERIKEKQEEDEVCQKLKQYCSEGWPERTRVPGALKPYWQVQDELSVVHGLLLKAERIVIPTSLRLEMLDRIHEGHQGVTKCRERAKRALWWPGLSRQIEDLVKQCRKCTERRINKKEPMIPSVVPDRPWQVIGTDICYVKKRPYLIVVDYFSKFIEVNYLTSLASSETIRALKSVFARHGIPEVVRSDNGPQYDSAEFTKFAKDWEFKHVTSSPFYAQSNGEAERAVQTAKNLLQKEGDPAKALLAYRSTPLQGGKSPSELLFGRQIRCTLPCVTTSLEPSWAGIENWKRDESERKIKQKQYYDARHGVKELQPLQPGDRVWVQSENKPGTVRVQQSDQPRSYTVETSGSLLRRNRSALLPYFQPMSKEKNKPDDDIGNREMEQASPEPERLERPELESPKDNAVRTRSGRIIRLPKRLDL